MAERYVLKFSKTGYMRYISHLDLLRLFKRMFRTGGIEIRYSQGFNPHPKLTFAQPLSLGYSGTGELLDFETAKPYDEAQIADLLKDQAPCGIDIISCRRLEDKTPSLASAAESAIYAIEIPAEAGHDWERKGEAYMAQQKIEALKRRKKDKKMQSVDIKPMIREMSARYFCGKIVIDTCLDCGSTSNCSPELVIASFCAFAGINTPRSEISVERKKIKFSNNLQI